MSTWRRSCLSGRCERPGAGFLLRKGWIVSWNLSGVASGFASGYGPGPTPLVGFGAQVSAYPGSARGVVGWSLITPLSA